MRERPAGQLVQRLGGGLLELLEHEELRAAHPDALLGGSPAHAQSASDLADALEHPGDLEIVSRRAAAGRPLASAHVMDSTREAAEPPSDCR